MQHLPKADGNVRIDKWSVFAAVFAVLISSMVGWLAPKSAVIVSLFIICLIGLIVILAASIRQIDPTVLWLLQLMIGCEIIFAPQFDQRSVTIVGVILLLIFPSVRWALSTTNIRFGTWRWLGYYLVFAGFFISWFSPFQYGGIPYVFGQGDATVLFIVTASYLIAQLISAGILSKRTILAILATCFSSLVWWLILSDLIEIESEGINHRLGVYTDFGPNLLAFCLDMSVPVSLGFALICKRRIFQVILGFNGLFQMVALLLTGTRGSIPTIFVTSIWLFFNFRKHRYFYAFALPVGVAVIGVLIQKTIGRLALRSDAEILSTLGRLLLLKISWSILEINHFLWGIGIDRFSKLKFDFGFPLWFNPTKSMSSHNTYLEYWLGWGGVALFGYLITVLRACFNLFRQGNTLDIAVAISILGYSLHGFVDSSVANYPMTFSFWLLLALGICNSANVEKIKE